MSDFRSYAAKTLFMIALSTAVTGVFLFILGQLRLGRLARFIPYPVMGGFLAGTAWLIAKSSFKVMLIGILNRYRHYLVLPSLSLGAIVLFHLIWAIVNQFFVHLNARGWFFEP